MNKIFETADIVLNNTDENVELADIIFNSMDEIVEIANIILNNIISCRNAINNNNNLTQIIMTIEHNLNKLAASELYITSLYYCIQSLKTMNMIINIHMILDQIANTMLIINFVCKYTKTDEINTIYCLSSRINLYKQRTNYQLFINILNIDQQQRAQLIINMVGNFDINDNKDQDLCKYVYDNIGNITYIINKRIKMKTIFNNIEHVNKFRNIFQEITTIMNNNEQSFDSAECTKLVLELIEL